MASPNLPNLSLLLAIERLKEATAKLPLSTPEGSSDGVVWQSFNVKPQSGRGAMFKKIDQAFNKCFSRPLAGANSGFEPIDNVLRGPFGMDVVIHFFEECARSSKLDSSASHLTELKVGQLIDLVYARIKSLPGDPPDNSTRNSKKQHHSNGSRRRKSPCTDGPDRYGSSDSDFNPEPTPPSSESALEKSNVVKITQKVTDFDFS